MSDTLPPDMVRRIRAETELVLNKAGDEREFREEMLRVVTRMEVKLDNITERMTKHEQDDRDNFAQVNQSIGGALTLRQIAWTMAGITATVATFWGVVELVTRVKP